MENNETLYETALKRIDDKTFEEIAIKYVKSVIPNSNNAHIRTPYGNAGDGGEDGFIEEDKTKIAASTQATWKVKIKSEIKKLKDDQDIKTRENFYYITRKIITTIEIDAFKRNQKKK